MHKINDVKDHLVQKRVETDVLANTVGNYFTVRSSYEEVIIYDLAAP